LRKPERRIRGHRRDVVAYLRGIIITEESEWECTTTIRDHKMARPSAGLWRVPGRWERKGSRGETRGLGTCQPLK
jgi:hypothetical protein